MRIRFALNTFYSGPQACFFLADDLGFFRDEGLVLEFIPGDTAANVVSRIAESSLNFDAGYGDINALIEHQAYTGSCPARVVYAVHNASPYAIACPRENKVQALDQLMACKLASHPKDAALKMLPELALRQGLKADDFEIELCSDPHPKMLQDMLHLRRWSGLFGFVNTLKAAAIEANINADQALSFIEYRHVLPELYGLGVMVSSSFEQAHPQAVVGLVKAVNRGLRACIDDPDAAIQAVQRRDPSIDVVANRARLLGTLALEMAHPESARRGLGSMDAARLAQAIQLIATAKRCNFRPEPGQIYTDQYLPGASSRIYDLARPLQSL